VTAWLVTQEPVSTALFHRKHLSYFMVYFTAQALTILPLACCPSGRAIDQPKPCPLFCQLHEHSLICCPGHGLGMPRRG